MPPRQYDIQGLANSLSGLSNAITSDINKQLKEKARSDLLNMQAQLDIESNRFMNNLSMKSNYENWEQEYDDWLQKQSNALQKSSANQYTAKAANEMLMGYSTNMRKNIENKVFDMRNRDMLLKNNDTVNLIMQNDGIVGQDKMDQIAKVLDPEALNNQVTRDQYEAKLKNVASNIYKNHYSKLGSQYIVEAIQNGESLQSIKDKIMNDDFSISFKAVDTARTSIDDYDAGNAQYIDISHTLDRNALKESVMKTVEQNYNAALTDIQNKSDKELSEYYNGIWQPGMSVQQQLHLCNLGLTMLKEQYGGDKLTTTKRIAYTNMFRNTAEELGKGSGGSGSGSGSANLKSFELQYKYAPENYLQQIANGQIADTYTAASILYEDQKKEFFSKEWKETANMTPLEKQQYWQRNWENLPFAKLLDSRVLTKRFEEDPRFSTFKAQLDKFKKDLIKDPTRYSPDAASMIDTFVCDFVASTGKEVTDQQIKQWNDMLDAVLISKSPLAKGDIPEIAAYTEDKDLVFTDDRTKTEYIPESRQKEFLIAQQKFIKDIKNNYGINVTFKGYEKTYNDSTSKMIFADEKGNEYTYESIRNKKDKGIKVKYFKNGEELEPPKETLKSEKKQERDKSNEYKNASDTVVNRFEEKAKYMNDSDYDELSKKLIAKGITYATVEYLKGADLETRASLIEEAELRK